jgi:hypothetical protein
MQAEYWITDVTAHYNTIRKVFTDAGKSIKNINGLMIVGNDTSTIDLPGRGRLKRDAITIPARFDFFANHPDVDLQWASNDTIGDSDIFMASLASVQTGNQQNSIRSGEMGLGHLTPGRRQHTMEPEQLHQHLNTSSPFAELEPFDAGALLTELQAGEGIDLGLDTLMTGEEMQLPLDDSG